MQQETVLAFQEILLQTKERAQIAIYEVGTTSSLVEMNPLQTKKKNP
jgi:hypothetical protein